MLTSDTSPFPTTVVDERRLDRRRFLGAAGAAVMLAGAGDWLARRLMGRAPALAPLAPDALADLAPG